MDMVSPLILVNLKTYHEGMGQKRVTRIRRCGRDCGEKRAGSSSAIAHRSSPRSAPTWASTTRYVPYVYAQHIDAITPRRPHRATFCPRRSGRLVHAAPWFQPLRAAPHPGLISTPASRHAGGSASNSVVRHQQRHHQCRRRQRFDSWLWWRVEAPGRLIGSGGAQSRRQTGRHHLNSLSSDAVQGGCNRMRQVLTRCGASQSGEVRKNSNATWGTRIGAAGMQAFARPDDPRGGFSGTLSRW